MAKHTRTYTRYTLEATGLLGQLIRLGRKRRRMTQLELAQRLGAARSTVQRIEQGDPRVEMGLVFEAAALVGVALFDAEGADLRARMRRVEDRDALLPQRIYKHAAGLIDDF